MYNKILTELGLDYYKENFPNDGQRFVAWYLSNIHNLDTFETSYYSFYHTTNVTLSSIF